MKGDVIGEIQCSKSAPFMRGDDVIFVVAGDDKPGTVHECFYMRNRCFKCPGELVQPEGEKTLWWFDDFAEIRRQPNFFSGNQRR